MLEPQTLLYLFKILFFIPRKWIISLFNVQEDSHAFLPLWHLTISRVLPLLYLITRLFYSSDYTSQDLKSIVFNTTTFWSNKWRTQSSGGKDRCRIRGTIFFLGLPVSAMHLLWAHTLALYGRTCSHFFRILYFSHTYLSLAY